jgi:hypothetical protein
MFRLAGSIPSVREGEADEAIQERQSLRLLDRFASLAMTVQPERIMFGTSG